MFANRLSNVIKVSIIAGLVAGLVMGLFHFLVTERLIDQAIALESEASPGTPELVSRGAQKVTLIVGSGLYGLIIGVIFAFVFTLLERRLPGKRSGTKALLLAGAMWWFFGLLLQLKYSAALPGVGDPATIYSRQWLQVSFVALSVLAAAAAWMAFRSLNRVFRTMGRGWQLSITATLYLLTMAIIFKLMPNVPGPGPELAGISAGFLALSISGHALFWATVGIIMAFALRSKPA
ncbi:MAG: CbtA family protein [Chloroflexi bacterium]|nr:CbtA family protein [Chloroflexota bacterium]